MTDGHQHAHKNLDYGHEGHNHGALGHGHAPSNFGKAFAIGVALNGAFVLIEVIAGVASNSVTLLADAGHNLSDALGLGVAWAAVILAMRKPTSRFTYGLGGTSILAAPVQRDVSADRRRWANLGSYSEVFTARAGDR